MARFFCGLLLAGMSAAATPVVAQQATKPGLVAIVDGKVIQAYVASGREGENLNAEIRP